MILVDMRGEFAGIYIGSLVLFLGQSLPLYYPFRPYRKYPELLDGGSYYGVLAVGTMVQIVIEIITDTVCLVFEARGGLAPLAVWRELPKAALTPIILFALMLATMAGQFTILNGDSVDQCNHRDVCWCVGDGLLPGGVREGYCLLLYPNSSGRPRNWARRRKHGHLWLCSQAQRRRPTGCPLTRGSSQPTKAVVALAALSLQQVFAARSHSCLQ
jgi:hypothetical protein